MKRMLLCSALLLSLGTYCLAEDAKPAAVKDAKKADTVVPLPREGRWMTRHELINKRVSEGPVDLVFIGDSITQGWEGSGAKVWEQFYNKRNARNLGIGGDRTQHIIWRLDNGNIKGIKPKLAVIMIGTNNSGSNTSQEIADGVAAISAQLKEKLPETKQLILAIFPRGATPDDPRRKVNEGANAQIAKLADNKTIFYLDIGPKFLEEDGTLTKKIMPDLLHLSPQGYEIWAKSIEPQVVELMGEK